MEISGKVCIASKVFPVLAQLVGYGLRSHSDDDIKVVYNWFCAPKETEVDAVIAVALENHGITVRDVQEFRCTNAGEAFREMLKHLYRDKSLDVRSQLVEHLDEVDQE